MPPGDGVDTEADTGLEVGIGVVVEEEELGLLDDGARLVGEGPGAEGPRAGLGGLWHDWSRERNRTILLVLLYTGRCPAPLGLSAGQSGQAGASLAWRDTRKEAPRVRWLLARGRLRARLLAPTLGLAASRVTVTVVCTTLTPCRTYSFWPCPG